VYAGSPRTSFLFFPPYNNILTLCFTCRASPAVLHLLCVESYVLMCPFYYSNYQSILFCVESVIKFQSHNDVCVCLSIVLYLLTPHSYNPHLSNDFFVALFAAFYCSIFYYCRIPVFIRDSCFSPQY
jgi:hypothetical protein